jgi:CheY-like chemotaxis protein/two-component sensor histidine kinase
LTFGREGEESKNKLKLSSIVKEALRTFRSSLPENIQLLKNIEAESSLIMANVIHIHQILMNLCTNASHAMEEKGGVLEVGLIDTEFDSDTMFGNTQIKRGKYVKLKVSDTGCGMSSEVIDRIFEPFFTTKEVGKGTGMGLSVVHGIIQKCGASIIVESEVGKGTAINIFFPKISGESKKTIEHESGNKTKGRILLVDDEEVMVDVTTQILERLGYNVTGKTSGTDALELFRKDSDRFDLVITDHRMPKMKETQLAQELMSVRHGIPVILCTGYSEDIGKEEAMNMGIKEYLMKPVTNKELSETIDKILNSQEVAA